MKKLVRVLLMLGCFSIASMGYASIDVYEFEDKQQAEDFSILEQELRCPKCQNQNIADSNAGLAKDIKDRAYKLLKEGKSREEITQYMVDRYGDFITYRPPVTRSTWVLWFGPFVLLIVVLTILLFFVKRHKKSGSRLQAESSSVSEEEKRKIESLLQRYGQDETKSEEE